MQSLHGRPWADCSHGLWEPCIAAATAPESLHGRPRCILDVRQVSTGLDLSCTAVPHVMLSNKITQYFGEFDMTTYQLASNTCLIANYY